jgi:hypothetical protein
VTLFKSEPNSLQKAIELSANLMIPKSQDDDSVASEECCPGSIATLGSLIVVSTVQFDRELRGRTIKIEYIWIERMLAPKFVTCKISVS